VQISVYESDEALEQRNRVEAELEKTRVSDGDDSKDSKDPRASHIGTMADL